MPDRFQWNDANRGLVKTLYVGGLSASQIINKTGFPVSRNAVIGQLHRMGVSRGDVPPVRAIREAKPEQPSKPKLVAPEVRRDPPQNAGLAFATRTFIPNVAVPFTEPTVGGVRIEDLHFAHCRWPIHAEGQEPRFCGKVKAGKSYCTAHAAKAYVAPKKPLARPPVEAGAAYRHGSNARWRGLA